MINKELFYEKLENWKNNTMFLSNISQIIEDENFVEIVSYGEKVVPFILEELSKNPSNLVWSLNLIYNNKISLKENTTIEEACRLWIKHLKK
jgi:hypothetical protein